MTAINGTRIQVAPPAPEAFFGLAGEVVATFDLYTEADPTAVLAQTLAIFGCQVGVRPHAVIGADLHPPRIFPVIVGSSSTGRKGTSASAPRKIAVAAEPAFKSQILSGLASGEGLIHAVRDAVEVWDEKKQANVVKDPGVHDKRALVQESEWARQLRTGKRDGSIISQVVREAFDSGSLMVTSRNTSARATGAHIVMAGQITPEELLREMSDTEAANGFGNRFSYVYSTRSKLLPEPKPFEGPDFERIVSRYAKALDFAKYVGRMERDASAGELWRSVYPQLTAERSGVAGALSSRAEAKVVRTALIYALFDHSTVVRLPHLQAALALQDYCERSVLAIFGDRLGDALADTIRDLLTRNPGQKRTDIHTSLGRNYQAARIDVALQALVEAGMARSEMEATGGRPAERWFPITRPRLVSFTSFLSAETQTFVRSHSHEVVEVGGRRVQPLESSSGPSNEFDEERSEDPDDVDDASYRESLQTSQPPAWLEEFAEAQV